MFGLALKICSRFEGCLKRYGAVFVRLGSSFRMTKAYILGGSGGLSNLVGYRLGLDRDNEKETGSYYIILGYILKLYTWRVRGTS